MRGIGTGSSVGKQGTNLEGLCGLPAMYVLQRRGKQCSCFGLCVGNMFGQGEILLLFIFDFERW